MDRQALRDSVTDAIRFWELRRVLYNLVLAFIVCVYFWIGLPSSKQFLKVDFILSLFLLAVIANVAYCAVYLVDIFAQMSDFREVWQRVRWLVFCRGDRLCRDHHTIHRGDDIYRSIKELVDGRGFEPPTPALRTRCSPN